MMEHARRHRVIEVFSSYNVDHAEIVDVSVIESQPNIVQDHGIIQSQTIINRPGCGLEKKKEKVNFKKKNYLS